MRDFVAFVRQHLPRRDTPLDRYDEVVDELAAALEARYVALVQRGASDEEAWRDVQAQVPSWPSLARELTAVASHVDAAGSLPRVSRLRRLLTIEGWTRELAYAIRVLRKDRGFAATAILTLAVCLGGHAAITAAVNGMLFHPLRIPAPDRVLLMANQYPRVEARRSLRSSTPDYDDRLRHVTLFDEQALYNSSAATIDVGGVPTRMSGMAATPSLFRLLRVNPAHGRTFTDEEGTPGSDDRVILTDGLWRELFAADPTAVGRTLRITGRECTIVGILPRGFSFGDSGARYWIPLVLTDRQRSDEARHRNGWFSVGRLKPGATIDQVRQQLEAMDAVNFSRVAPRLQSILLSTGFYTGVEPLQEALVRGVRGPLTLLWGAALVVLAIGVGNLAIIALARARARLNELGTRLTLGASRLDIVRQLLVEAVLIAAAGAGGALALAAWMLSAVRSTIPGAAPLQIDAAVAGVTLGLGLLAGVPIGIVSALPLYTMKLGTLLHDGMRGRTPGRSVRTTWRSLVVAQMTCSFILLMGCALLWVSLRNLLAVDPGFRTDGVITGIVSLAGPRYAADAGARDFVSRSLDGIRQLPGIVAAGATTIVPMTSGYQSGVVIAEGHTPRPGELPVSGIRSMVTPGYFEAVGTPLVSGRYFDARDDHPSSRSIVIDERLARRFWPDGDAVGRRVFSPITANQLSKVDATTPWLTVIGVVRTALLNGPVAPDGPIGTFYIPYATMAPRDLGYVIRVDREEAGVVRDVRSVLAGVDRAVALFDIRTVSERTEVVLASRTNTMRLAMLFAAVGVFLSALGLYGMLAYVVTQRTREIGVRLAVGSAPRAILGLVLREGLWLALAGIVIGAGASLAFGRLLASHLYGVAPSNPWVMLVMAATLAAIAVAACIIPARRAAHLDVMRILNAP